MAVHPSVSDPHHAPAPTISPRRAARLISSIVAFAVLSALSLPLTNLFIRPVVGAPLSAAAEADTNFAAATEILNQNCLACHTHPHDAALRPALPGPRPFNLTAAAIGTRYFNLPVELAPSDTGRYNEAALAKLEFALDHHQPPSPRHVWQYGERALTAAEKQVIRDAIHALRREHFATPGVAPEFATYAIQPLPDALEFDLDQATLGAELFFDSRLSVNNTRTCAFCHGLSIGGCDRRDVSIGVYNQRGPINSPTVYNSAFNFAQFWDGRARDLHDQAGGPITNPIEMGSKWEQVLEKLGADEEVVTGFEAAYADGLTADNVTHAIAEFEKTLITPDSKFDQYLKGDADALNEDELAGLRLFEANGCVTCHAGKILGGQSYELMGRRKDYFALRGRELTDADLGRYNVTKDERDKHKFKVPMLRNIAVTQPYFHDASETTLAGAVRVMAQVNGYRDFTEEEVAQVVAFLHTLTGKFNGEPLQ